MTPLVQFHPWGRWHRVGLAQTRTQCGRPVLRGVRRSTDRKWLLCFPCLWAAHSHQRNRVVL